MRQDDSSGAYATTLQRRSAKPCLYEEEVGLRPRFLILSAGPPAARLQCQDSQRGYCHGKDRHSETGSAHLNGPTPMGP